MTTEEKAKAYDEALEQAKKELKVCCSLDCDAARQIFRFFPQLVESEDERIRKWILLKVQEYVSKAPVCSDEIKMGDKAIDWLEKQKNCILVPKSHLDPPGKEGEDGMKILEKQKEQSNPLEDYSRGYNDGYYHELTDKKQKESLHIHETCKENANSFTYEQKPVDDFEKWIDGWYKEHCSPKHGLIHMNEKEFKNWSRGIRNMHEQKPAEWSEKHIADIFEKVGLAKIVREQGNDKLTNALQDAMLELSKVGNTEWSEEDERISQGLIEMYKNEHLVSVPIGVHSKDIIRFLENLRPSWKPSEEDLMMLEHIIGQYETGNKNSKVMGYLPRIEELNFLKNVLTKWKNLL